MGLHVLLPKKKTSFVEGYPYQLSTKVVLTNSIAYSLFMIFIKPKRSPVKVLNATYITSQ